MQKGEKNNRIRFIDIAKGIATNAKTPNHLIHQIFFSLVSASALSLMLFEERLILFSIASASFLKSLVFFSHLKIGQNKNVRITQTKELPKTESKNDFQSQTYSGSAKHMTTRAICSHTKTRRFADGFSHCRNLFSEA